MNWLLDMVEIEGVVRDLAKAGLGDDFAIEPDANYQHLISLFRGNNPLPWFPATFPGAMHCEAYVPPASALERPGWWPIGDKPGRPESPELGEAVPFMVKLGDGSTRPLAVGDHVRVVGRWIVDHHPEYCDPVAMNQPPGPTRCFEISTFWGASLLRAGAVHAELHPILWDDIRLVEPPRPRDTVTVTLSLAAPIHELQFLGNWKWFANEIAGVAGRVCLLADGSSFHETMTAHIRIEAPTLGPEWSGTWSALRMSEEILQNGSGTTSLEQVRAINVVSPNAIEVDASITAKGSRRGQRPSIHDPSLGRGVFQARYSVWRDYVGQRIACVTKPVRSDPDEHIEDVGGVLPDGSRWRIKLAEAVGLVKGGHNFYVEEPSGDRVDVIVQRSAFGHEYLKTVADGDLPNNLLSLPECPPL